MGIFQLPFIISLSTPVLSESYKYGFNNKVSIIFTILLFFIICFLKKKGLFFSSVDKIELDKFDIYSSTDASNKVAVFHFYIVCLLYLIFIILYYFFTDGNFGEAEYFAKRIDRIILGGVPYVDFEYAYGVIFIYLPAWIYSAFNLFDLRTSYYIVYTLMSFCSIYILLRVVQVASISKLSKTLIFYLISFAAYSMSMGLNYVILRFITPFGSILFLDHFVKNKSLISTLRGNVEIFFITILLVFFNLLISSEGGLVFGIACVIYFFLFLQFDGLKYAYLTALYCILLIFSFLILPKNYFLVVFSFSEGGNNFPVLPSIFMILYLFTILFPLSDFIILGYRRKDPLQITFILICIGMMPAALGRCDPAHILFFGIGAFITSLIFFSKLYKSFFNKYSFIFFVVFFLGYHLTDLLLYKEQFQVKIFKKLEKSVPPNKLISISKNIASFLGDNPSTYENQVKKYLEISSNISANLYKLDRYSSVIAPYGTNRTIYDYLKKRNKYVLEYYEGDSNVFTIDQIDKKLNKIKKDSESVLLMPVERFYIDALSVNADHSEILTKLFLYPFKLQVKNNITLEDKLVSYIKDNYEIVDSIDNYKIMIRNINFK